MAVKGGFAAGKSGVNEGQIDGREKFADPREAVTPGVGGMGGTHNDIGEMSGFETEGYIVKKGTVYGEGAKLNLMPPGMDIDNQEMADIRSMPMKKVVDESYPGDGWEPMPRHIE